METKRVISLEESYKSLVSIEHRKEYAQFFTPKAVADLMSAWVADVPAGQILDPAFGLGIFARSLRSLNFTGQITGFDIDPTILNQANAYFGNDDRCNIVAQDFLRSDWSQKYDGIICNPPYFKFHDFDNTSYIHLVNTHLETSLNGFTNLYALFLLKAIHQLRTGGRGAFIIPSEFLNSDYGVFVKQFLKESETLRHIFVIDFKESVFDDALTTACIILFAKDENPENHVAFSTIENRNDLRKIQNAIENYPAHQGDFMWQNIDLNPQIKWRGYYEQLNGTNFTGLVPFTNYARVKRGIATGDNGYFALTRQQADNLGISDEYLVQCICQSRGVLNSFFTEAEFQSLVNLNGKAYLFNGLASENPDQAIMDYLVYGVEIGASEKFLTSNRNPWYKLENKDPAPIWVSVFNRNSVRFIRNEAMVRNLTCFHSVYPNSENIEDIDLLFAYLNTTLALDILSDNRREYGNGLHKFEPNDINKGTILDINNIQQEHKTVILTELNHYKQGNLEALTNIERIFLEYYQE